MAATVNEEAIPDSEDDDSDYVQGDEYSGTSKGNVGAMSS